MENKKRILFISGIDFKEKSIQVIRKTPEAYVSAGFEVDYLVARDTSEHGNYFYEQVFDPKGVNVIRIKSSWIKFRNRFHNSKLLVVIFTKLASYFTIIRLSRLAKKLCKGKKYDVIYGYEIAGTLAVRLLRSWGYGKKAVVVSRFQGTWLTQYIEQRRRLKLLLNWEAIWAMKIKTDLTIMTDDGTKGDVAFKKFNGKNKFVFWTNGVDEQLLEKPEYEEVFKKHKLQTGTTLILSVCRLESWKRVDRIFKMLNVLVYQLGAKNVKLLVVGEGAQRINLSQLVKELNLSDYVEFVGGLKHSDVKKYLNAADIFCSTYDLSNVGNPLLEAIRANKIIFTLNNGDTSSWIKHKENGFIYEVNDQLYSAMATDVYKLIKHPELGIQIKEKLKKTEKEKLWNWEERLNEEIKQIKCLL